jgi:hypothetical protein
MQPTKHIMRPEVLDVLEHAMRELETDLEYLRAHDLLDSERLDIVRRSLLRLAAQSVELPLEDGDWRSLAPN